MPSLSKTTKIMQERAIHWREMHKYLPKHHNWEPKIRVGILEGATNQETGKPIAPYAAMNEYGAPGIPERPFMRETVKDNKEKWIKGFQKMIQNGVLPEIAMVQLGKIMAQDMQRKIKSNMGPPNSPKTRAKKKKTITSRKKGTKEKITRIYTPGTLIDTGSMLKSIDFEVIL